MLNCTRTRCSLTFEVDFPISVRVKYVDDSLHKWILLELWQGHELLHAKGAGVIQVEFLKPLPQPLNLISINWKGEQRETASYFQTLPAGRPEASSWLYSST